MKTEPVEDYALNRIRYAESQLGNATQALRDANIGAKAVLSDALIELIGRSKELQDRVGGLAVSVKEEEKQLTPRQRKDLVRLLNYSAEAEEKNYEENKMNGWADRKHISHTIRRIAKAIGHPL